MEPRLDAATSTGAVHAGQNPNGATAVGMSRRMIRAIHDRLWKRLGPQGWWPGKSRTEVVIGAILTQNTAWVNVERAIRNLRAAGCLDFDALHRLPRSRLERLIQPSGTYRVKAARLAAFVEALWQRYGGCLPSMLHGDLEDVRTCLLGIHGIGPETADAILLYAGDRATFVVDAYTKRILRRHFLIEKDATYENVRGGFHGVLGRDSMLFNEFHAMFVATGKQSCRVRARCRGCPLEDLAHDETL